MALREQLRQLLQNKQPSGVITVERPLLPAAAAEDVQPAASEPPPSSPPAPPSLSPGPRAGGLKSVPRGRGLVPEECAVFHCRDCWAVLGDSLHLCAQEEQRLHIFVCFKVTKDVVWEDSLMVGLEGALLGCAYKILSCQLCGLIVGFILHSSAGDWAYLRGFFCFFKDRITCYLLRNQITVEASKVTFPAVSMKRRVDDLKKRLMEMYVQIELLREKLKQLEKRILSAERQIFVSDVASLPPGYAIFRVN